MNLDIKMDSKEIELALKSVTVKGVDLYNVLKSSSQNMVSRIRATIPINTGNLRESVGVIERTPSAGVKEQSAILLIGYRTYSTFKGFHGSILEHGRKPHFKGEVMKRGRKGRTYRQNTAAMTGRKFLQKGFDENIQETTDMATIGILKLVNLELSKQKLPQIK